MKLARFSLYLVGVSFLGLGALFLVSPASITAQAEVSLPTPIAVMEVRGVYGGFFLGTGLFFLIFARRDAWLRPGLVAQSSIMGGLVLGRTLGIVLDGSPSRYLAFLLTVEVLAVVVALIALRRLNGSTAV
jgi:hypothetical protein